MIFYLQELFRLKIVIQLVQRLMGCKKNLVVVATKRLASTPGHDSFTVTANPVTYSCKVVNLHPDDEIKAIDERQKYDAHILQTEDIS